jgi:D-glycero-D-manno-heptose 1,7-bisphosphate phosphatase
MDRDGTVCEEVGYMNHPDRLMIYPWSAEAIRLVNQFDMKAIVVTNQAGVARGYFKEELVIEVHKKLIRDVERSGARLDAIYYCPHHPEAGEYPYRQQCHCRKPKPGMVLKAAEDFDLNVTGSYVLGDRYGDILLAKNTGATSIFLLSGYGKGEYEYQRHNWQVQPDHVAENLLEGVRWILKRET